MGPGIGVDLGGPGVLELCLSGLHPWGPAPTASVEENHSGTVCAWATERRYPLVSPASQELPDRERGVRENVLDICHGLDGLPEQRRATLSGFTFCFLWLWPLRLSSRDFSCLGGTSHPRCPPPRPVPQRCQMGWSKAARPDLSPALSSPPQAPREPGGGPGRVADGGLGGGAARQTDDCQDRWRTG